MGLMSAEGYKDFLASLFPRGAAWNLFTDFKIKKISDSFAQELERVDSRGLALLAEIDPNTTSELLTDFERLLGLPDLGLSLGSTTEKRRGDILAKLTNSGGQTIAYYIQLAANLGVTITIIEFKNPRCGIARCGDRLTAGSWKFAFKIVTPLGISSEDLTRLRLTINRYKPAHTIAIFTDNTLFARAGVARAGDRLRTFY